MPGPYRLLTTGDPGRTLGEAVDAGDVTYHATILDAANAFAKSEAAFKAVLFDDGCEARELTDDEDRLLTNVCAHLGYDVHEVEA